MYLNLNISISLVYHFLLCRFYIFKPVKHKINRSYLMLFILFVKRMIMNAEQILKQHGIKKTVCRKCIIDKLIESDDTALTENEIKDAFLDLFDRVTFYRSLKTLEEAKVIHRIVLNNTIVKYALTSQLVLSKIHPHFHCTYCDKVTCLDSSLLDRNLHLPSGYQVESAQVLLEGTCPDCIKSKRS